MNLLVHFVIIMATWRDVLKVHRLHVHLPTTTAILRTFKTSLVPINNEMHLQSIPKFKAK